MDRRSEVRAVIDGHHPRFGRIVPWTLDAFIFFSALSVGIETEPNLPSWAVRFLALAEIVIVAVFTVEYALRIYAAENRWRYIRSFWGLVDLAAILPFYLSLGWVDLRGVRVLRLLRLFRLLKIARYSAAADRLGAAIFDVKEELIVFGAFAIVTLYLCAVGIYYFEHDAQPQKFVSVFDCMWWAAVTLTTVGYGDIYPITTGGRIFTVLVLFLALGVIAVPTGLVGSALMKLRGKGELSVDHGDKPAGRGPDGAG
jgi:voltage-gated potassium channel